MKKEHPRIIILNSNNRVLTSYGQMNPQIYFKQSTNSIGTTFIIEEKQQSNQQAKILQNAYYLRHQQSGFYLSGQAYLTGFKFLLTQNRSQNCLFLLEPKQACENFFLSQNRVCQKFYIKHYKTQAYLSTIGLIGESVLSIEHELFYLIEHIRIYQSTPQSVIDIATYWKKLKDQQIKTIEIQNLKDIIMLNLKLLLSKFELWNKCLKYNCCQQNQYQTLFNNSYKHFQEIENVQVHNLQKLRQQILYFVKLLEELKGKNEQKLNSQKWTSTSEFSSQLARFLTLCDYAIENFTFAKNSLKYLAKLQLFHTLLDIDRDLTIQKLVYCNIQYYTKFLATNDSVMAHSIITRQHIRIKQLLQLQAKQKHIYKLYQLKQNSKWSKSKIGKQILKLFEKISIRNEKDTLMIQDMSKIIVDICLLLILVDQNATKLVQKFEYRSEYEQMLKAYKFDREEISQFFKELTLDQELSNFVKKHKSEISYMFTTLSRDLTICKQKQHAQLFTINKIEQRKNDQEITITIQDNNTKIFQALQQKQINQTLQLQNTGIYLKSTLIQFYHLKQPCQKKYWNFGWIGLLKLPTALIITTTIQLFSKLCCINQIKFNQFIRFIHKFNIYELIFRAFLDNLYPFYRSQMYLFLQRAFRPRKIQIQGLLKISVSNNSHYGYFIQKIAEQLIQLSNLKLSEEDSIYLNKKFEDNNKSQTYNKIIEMLSLSVKDSKQQDNQIYVVHEEQKFSINQICKQLLKNTLNNKGRSLVQMENKSVLKDLIIEKKNQIDIKKQTIEILDKLLHFSQEKDQLQRLTQLNNTLYQISIVLLLVKQSNQDYVKSDLENIIEMCKKQMKEEIHQIGYFRKRIIQTKNQIIQNLITILQQQVLFIVNKSIQQAQFLPRQKQLQAIKQKIATIPRLIQNYFQFFNESNVTTNSLLLKFITNIFRSTYLEQILQRTINIKANRQFNQLKIKNLLLKLFYGKQNVKEKQIIDTVAQVRLIQYTQFKDTIQFSMDWILCRYANKNNAFIDYQDTLRSLLGEIVEIFKYLESKQNLCPKEIEKQYEKIFWKISAYSLIVSRRKIEKIQQKNIFLIVQETIKVLQKRQKIEVTKINFYILLDLIEEIFIHKMQTEAFDQHFQSIIQEFAIFLMQLGHQRSQWESIILCRTLNLIIQLNTNMNSTFYFLRKKLQNRIQYIILANNSQTDKNVNEAQRYYRVVIGAQIAYIFRQQNKQFFQQIKQRVQSLLFQQSHNSVNLLSPTLSDLTFAIRLNCDGWIFEKILIQCSMGVTNYEDKQAQQLFQQIRNLLIKAQAYLNSSKKMSVYFIYFLMGLPSIINLITSKKFEVSLSILSQITESLFRLKRFFPSSILDCNLFLGTIRQRLCTSQISKSSQVDINSTISLKYLSLNPSISDIQQNKQELLLFDEYWQKQVQNILRNNSSLLKKVIWQQISSSKQLMQDFYNQRLISLLYELEQFDIKPSQLFQQKNFPPILFNYVVSFFGRLKQFKIQNQYRFLARTISLALKTMKASNKQSKQFKQQQQQQQNLLSNQKNQILSVQLTKQLQSSEHFVNNCRLFFNLVTDKLLHFYGLNHSESPMSFQDYIFSKNLDHQNYQHTFKYALASITIEIIGILELIWQQPSLKIVFKRDIKQFMKEIFRSFCLLCQLYQQNAKKLIVYCDNYQDKQISMLRDSMKKILELLKKISQKFFQKDNEAILTEIALKSEFFAQFKLLQFYQDYVIPGIQAENQIPENLKQIIIKNSGEIQDGIIYIANNSITFLNKQQKQELMYQIKQQDLQKYIQNHPNLNQHAKLLLRTLYSQQQVANDYKLQLSEQRIFYLQFCKKGTIYSAYFLKNSQNSIQKRTKEIILNNILKKAQHKQQLIQFYKYRYLAYNDLSQDTPSQKFTNLSQKCIFCLLFILSALVIFVELSYFYVNLSKKHLKSEKYFFFYVCVIHLIFSIIHLDVYLSRKSIIYNLQEQVNTSKSWLRKKSFLLQFHFNTSIINNKAFAIFIISLASILFSHSLHLFMLIVLFMEIDSFKNLMRSFWFAKQKLFILSLASITFAFIFGYFISPLYIKTEHKKNLSCKNPFMCFISLFSPQVLGKSVSINSQYYITIFLLNTLYWFVFARLFNNTLFGIITDSFQLERRNADEILSKRKKRCLICGKAANKIQEQQYGFQKHTVKHNIWNYLYILYQIQNSKKQQLRSFELYLKQQLSKLNSQRDKINAILGWLPIEKQ